MDITTTETALKKKLQRFLTDLQRLGTVVGFKHFSSYVRGREEVVVTINNSLESGEFSVPSSRRQSVCPSDSLSSSQLPYDKGHLVLSHNTQMGLSGRRERGIGLPPASPSEAENGSDNDTTLFLVAGYGRYCCPYVWVRSNHERLFKMSGDVDNDRDSPLRLKSTARWKDIDVHASDIIAELVRLCTFPHPLNPFEVDLGFFQSLPHQEKLLASAAMLALLQRIVIHTPDDKAYAGKVSEDLQLVSKLHFNCLREMTESQSIPVLKQPARQQSRLNTNNRRPPPQQQGRQQQQQQQHPPPPPMVTVSSASNSCKEKVQLQQQHMFHLQKQQQQQQYQKQQQQQKPPSAAPPSVHQQVRQSYPSSQQPLQQQQAQKLPPTQHPPQHQQGKHSQPPPPTQNPRHPTAPSTRGYPPGFNAVQQRPQGHPGQPRPQGYAGHGQNQAPPPPTQQAPVRHTNPNAGRVYGQGPRGAFPGGFERTPAPTLF